MGGLGGGMPIRIEASAGDVGAGGGGGGWGGMKRLRMMGMG